MPASHNQGEIPAPGGRALERARWPAYWNLHFHYPDSYRRARDSRCKLGK